MNIKKHLLGILLGVGIVPLWADYTFTGPTSSGLSDYNWELNTNWTESGGSAALGSGEYPNRRSAGPYGIELIIHGTAGSPLVVRSNAELEGWDFRMNLEYAEVFLNSLNKFQHGGSGFSTEGRFTVGTGSRVTIADTNFGHFELKMDVTEPNGIVFTGDITNLGGERSPYYRLNSQGSVSYQGLNDDQATTHNVTFSIADLGLGEGTTVETRQLIGWTSVSNQTFTIDVAPVLEDVGETATLTAVNAEVDLVSVGDYYTYTGADGFYVKYVVRDPIVPGSEYLIFTDTVQTAGSVTGATVETAGGNTPAVVSYHNSLSDAENNVNAIADITTAGPGRYRIRAYVDGTDPTYPEVTQYKDFTILPASLPAADHLFIDANGGVYGAHANPGTDWDGALPISEIDAALTTANVGVFLKSGTYDVAQTLNVPAGKVLYGGFAGTETTAADRAKVANGFAWEFESPTILDGGTDIGARVLTLAGGTIDGITVQNGNAGGIQMTGGGAKVRFSIVRDNTGQAAESAGCAIGVNTGMGKIFVEDSWVHNNRFTSATSQAYKNHSVAAIGGGLNAGTPMDITRCMVTNNHNPYGISCFWTRNNAITVVNTLIAYNESGDGGKGAVAEAQGSTISLVNCTMVKNKGASGTHVLVAGGTRNATNSVVWGNNGQPHNLSLVNNNAVDDETAPTGTNLQLSAANEGTANAPGFKTVPANDPGYQATYPTADWSLWSGSLMIDHGDNSLTTETVDLAGNNRYLTIEVTPGDGTIDMGAFEYASFTPEAPDPVSAGGGALDLQWVVVPGAAATAGYQYQVDEVATFDSPSLMNGTSNSNGVFLSDMASGDYHFRFRAINDNGTIITDWSLAGTATVTPVLGLTITLDGSTLSWQAEAEIGVSHYKVQQFIDGQWVTIEELTAGAQSYESMINPAFDVRLLVIDQSGFTQSFLPDLAGKARVSYTLKTGWNLLGLPLDDADMSGLEAAIDGQPMVWNGVAYEVSNELQAGDAFFVYASAPAEVVVTGTKTVKAIELVKGWNLVGVTENQEAPVDAAIIYTLNEAYETVVEQAILLEGVGYWIYRN